MGHIEELRRNSDYIKCERDVQDISNFIVSTFEEKGLLEDFDDSSSCESDYRDCLNLLDNAENDDHVDSRAVSLNRYAAVVYAVTRWSVYNEEYPNFSGIGAGGDCTNFASQVLEAGGFTQYGKGDGCKYEVTDSEWYAIPNPDSPWDCWGRNSSFEWSTGWSGVMHFKNYWQDSGEIEVLGHTTNWKLAGEKLQADDIVQLQEKRSDGKWAFSHTMVVTGKKDGDLLMSYHSSNKLNNPLSNILVGQNTRYVLLRVRCKGE